METLSNAKHNDILKAFFNEIKEMNQYSVTREDVIRNVMSKGAPRFYVTPEKARRYISILNRGGDTKLTNPHKIAMYNEIYRRYKLYIQEHNIKGYGIIDDILCDILCEPAPSFYISVRTVKDIIYTSYKKRKCRLS